MQHEKRKLEAKSFIFGQVAMSGLALVAILLTPRGFSAEFTSVFAWGNRNNATDVPVDLTNAVAITSSGDDNIALKPNGTLIGWGESVASTSPTISSQMGVKAVSVGYLHGLALLSNGTAVAWGSGTAGENTVPPGLSEIAAVAAGGHHNLALKSNGTVVAWGANNSGETNVPIDLGGVTEIAASTAYNGAHNLALKLDGTVIGWGENFAGQATPPQGLNNVIAIAAGWYHSLALRSDGTVIAWGNNDNGKTNVPAGLSNVVAIAAGADHSVAAKADGTVVVWGSNFSGQRNVPDGLTNVFRVSAGRAHTLALSTVPAIFLVQPQSQIVYAGSNVVFHAQAIGPGNLTYQWIKDGFPLAGATGSDLTLLGVTSGDGGSYAAMVSNVGGSVTSAPASLVVNKPPPPEIQVQPQSVTAYVNESASFSVTATNEPLFYQWRKDGASLPAATGRVLSFSSVEFTNAGTYTVVITNGSGSITSSPVTLSVIAPSAPSIQTQPRSTNVLAGESISLSITASGGVLYYQWRKDGVAIPGATASVLRFPSVAYTNAAIYSVIVSNYTGSITSAPAVLSVTRPPFNVIAITPTYQSTQFAINGAPGNPTLTLMRGSSYAFTISTGASHPFQIVDVSGTPYNDGVSNNNIATGTLTFTIPNSAPATLRYICSVHFFGGTINIIDFPQFKITSIDLATNTVILKSLGSSGWLAVPEFGSTLVGSNWAVVPGYNNTLVSGTNITTFSRLDPVCGSNLFFRIRNTPTTVP